MGESGLEPLRHPFWPWQFPPDGRADARALPVRPRRKASKANAAKAAFAFGRYWARTSDPQLPKPRASTTLQRQPSLTLDPCVQLTDRHEHEATSTDQAKLAAHVIVEVVRRDAERGRRFLDIDGIALALLEAGGGRGSIARGVETRDRTRAGWFD